MRTSSVVVSLAIAAAAAPALAYPVSSPITRRGDDTPASPIDESGAAINWGHVLTGASIGIPIIGGIIDHFTNKNNGQKREVNDLLELLVRADVDVDDESAAAIKWGNVLTGVSIGMPIIGGIIDHFTNKNNGQKRDVNEFLKLLAREDVDDESAAAIKWGNVLTGASIGIPIIGGIIDHFTNKNNSQKREFDESGALAFLETLGSMSTPEGKREFAELLARADAGEDSEAAIDFYKAANWGSAVNNIFNIVNGIYTHIRDKREFDEVLARADDDESGAAWNAEQINGITSLAYYGYNMLSGIIDDALHKKGKRDLAELIARASEDDTVSAALALGLLGHFSSAKPNAARSLNELD